MKFYEQVTHYSCGAAAFRNLLSLYKRKYTEKAIRELCLTRTQGTSIRGFINACNYFGFDVKHYMNFTKKRGDKAIDDLKRLLDANYKPIMCVDNFSHWVLCIGYREDSLILVNSESGSPRIKYYTKDELLKKWWGNDKRYFDRSQYYCLCIKVK